MKFKRIVKENVKYLLSGIELVACLLAPFLIFMLSQYAFEGYLDSYSFGVIIVNYAIIACVMYTLFAFSNSLKFSIATTGIFFLGFSIINYFVAAYRGTPILPWDIIAYKTALNVAKSYSFKPTVNIVVASILMAVFLILVFKLLPKRKFFSKNTMVIRTIGLLAAVGLFSTFNTASDIEKMGIQTDTWNHSDAYRRYGIPSEFVLNMKFIDIEKPEGYSKESTQEILDSVKNDEEKLVNIDDVNIIVIMNESWTDFEEYGNITLSEPVMENIKSLDNAIFGHAYSSVWGGGTSQSEFEFLTGNSMAFLPPNSVPYQQYLNDDTMSYVWLLKNAGYETIAFHSYYASGWNRTKAYEYLGFDDFISMEDMHEELAFGHQDFCLDEVDFKEIIYRYENRDTSKPFFMFNVTMQNHGGYDDYILRDVEVEGTDNAYPKAEFYLSLVNETDEAFMDLVDYFSNVDEPTIILMYGDHQPHIEEEFSFKAMGIEDTSYHGELIDRHRVPYVFWANYELPDIERKDTSLNYLMQDLLSLSGNDSDDYGRFISEFRKTIPSISFNGYFDNDGNFYTYDEESEYSDYIKKYQILAYERLFDEIVEEKYVSN